MNRAFDIWVYLNISRLSVDSERMQELSFDIFDKLQDLLEMDRKEMAELICITPAQLSKRSTEGKFRTGESKAIYETAQLLDSIYQLFEVGVQTGNAWLKRPAKAFNQKTPIDRIKSKKELLI